MKKIISFITALLLILPVGLYAFSENADSGKGGERMEGGTAEAALAADGQSTSGKSADDGGSGADGENRESGEAGADGESRESGEAGADGENRESGEAGADGENRESGEAETDGENRESGEAETDGENRESGEAGADGETQEETEDEAAEEENPSEESGKGSKSIFQLLDKSEISYEANLAEYYLSEMTAAAAAGDVEAGREACENRNYIIDTNGMECLKISFDDLYLLAKLINAEAGCDWLTEDFRMCMGEVVLNRVASPEFPNTLYEVVYQPGQYSAVSTAAFANLVPGEEFVSIALRLLQGERQMVESVVYQSSYIQGEIFSVYEDWRLGTTYFCLSTRLELYPID